MFNRNKPIEEDTDDFFDDFDEELEKESEQEIISKLGHRVRFKERAWWETLSITVILLFALFLVYQNRVKISDFALEKALSGLDKITESFESCASKELYDLVWMDEAEFVSFMKSDDFTPNEVDSIEGNDIQSGFKTKDGGSYNTYYGTIEYEYIDYKNGKKYRKALLSGTEPLRGLMAVCSIDKDSQLYAYLDCGYEINIKKDRHSQSLRFLEDGSLEVIEEIEN